MSGDYTTWLLLVLIFGLLIWNLTRRRRTGNTNLDAALAVLTDVNHNLKVMEERLTNWQSKKKFQIKGWRMYKDKLGFLDTDLNSSLNESFALADEFNARIETARKNQALYTLQDMQVERLRGPLTKSKEGLVNWLRSAYEAEQQNGTRRGCMGF
jgi:hypothetical protein